ncbi:ribonuclease H-like domain-containing protein [Tanacetum coccineum]
MVLSFAVSQIFIWTETSTSCLVLAGSEVAYLLIYVDHIFLTVSSPALLQQIIDSLHRLFLSRRKYALQLLKCAYMVNCNPSRTPVDTESKLGPKVGTLDFGLHLYVSTTTSLVGYSDVDWAGYPSTRIAEAEYQGVANIVAETAWLRNLLFELHSPLLTVTISTVITLVRVLHVPSRYQYADIFTKRLPSALFEEFRSSLSILPPLAPTAGAY